MNGLYRASAHRDRFANVTTAKPVPHKKRPCRMREYLKKAERFDSARLMMRKCKGVKTCSRIKVVYCDAIAFFMRFFMDDDPARTGAGDR